MHNQKRRWRKVIGVLSAALILVAALAPMQALVFAEEAVTSFRTDFSSGFAVGGTTIAVPTNSDSQASGGLFSLAQKDVQHGQSLLYSTPDCTEARSVILNDGSAAPLFKAGNYKISMSVLVETASPTIALGYGTTYPYGAVPVNLGTTLTTLVSKSPVTDGWVTLEGAFTLTADTKGLAIAISDTGKAYIDDLSIEPGAADLADRYSTDFTNAVAGTALLDVPVSVHGNGKSQASGAAFTIEKKDDLHGNSLKVNQTTGTMRSWVLNDGEKAQVLKAGTYDVTAKMFAETAGTSFCFGTYFVSDANGWAGNVPCVLADPMCNITPNKTGEWVDVSATFTLAKDAYFLALGATGAGLTWVDDLTITPRAGDVPGEPTSGSYFTNFSTGFAVGTKIIPTDDNAGSQASGGLFTLTQKDAAHGISLMVNQNIGEMRSVIINNGTAAHIFKAGFYRLSASVFAESGPPTIVIGTNVSYPYGNVPIVVRDTVASLSRGIGTVGEWHTVTVFFALDKDVKGLAIGVSDIGIAYIDDLSIEPCEQKDVTITLDTNGGDPLPPIASRTGALLELPNPTREGYDFVGWYTDDTFTTPAPSNASDEDITLVAKWEKSGAPVNLRRMAARGSWSGSVFDMRQIAAGGRSARSLVLEGYRDQYTGIKRGIRFNDGLKGYTFVQGQTLRITYTYCISDRQGDPGATSYQHFQESWRDTCLVNFIVGTAGDGVDVDGTTASGNLVDIVNDTPNQWITKTCYVYVEQNGDLGMTCSYIYARIAFSEIDVEVMGEDTEPTLFLDYRYDGKTELVTGKPGDPLNLPTPTRDGYRFCGWYKDYAGKYPLLDSEFPPYGLIIGYAQWASDVTEDFENTDYAGRRVGYDGNDADWELYDATASGHSTANVRSGKMSLHRIGAEPGNKAYSVYMNRNLAKNYLINAQNYTLRMWVRIDQPAAHDLGTIRLIGNKSWHNAWDTDSDIIDIVAVADICDGKWHEVVYTFTASSHYIAIAVPGNLSLYIDDISLRWTPDPVSLPVVGFKEYDPRFLDENGKYPADEPVDLPAFELVERADDALDPVEETVTEYVDEVSQIIREETHEETHDETKQVKKKVIKKVTKTVPGNKLQLLPIILCGAGVILLGVLAVVILNVTKKRKAAKQNEKA